MTTLRILTAAVMLLFCEVGTARAQNDHRVGLTMGYPTSAGVLWHVTDRIAIRPEIDFSRTKVTFERTGTSIPPFDDENTSTVVRPGVSALFYLGQVEQLRTYVSPRFVYVSTDTSGSDETTSYLVSGSFGAHYRPVSRFAIFGEMGIQWTRSTFRSAPLEIPVLPSPITGTTTLRNTGVSLRSGVGVVLYF